MERRFAPVVLAFVTALGIAASPGSRDTSEDPRQAGEALAEALRSQRPAEEIETTGMLRLRNAQGKRSAIPVKFELRIQGDSWKAIYETIATNQILPERLEVIHSPGRPNQYSYAAAPDKSDGKLKPTAVDAARLSQSFGGSDFWLADLGMEFLHWPDQRLVRSEMRKGRSCRVLESRAPSPAAGAYLKVLSWVDLETGGLLRAEACDALNQALKEFSVRSVKKGQLKEVQLRNLKSDSVTRLEFDLKLEGFPDQDDDGGSSSRETSG